VTAPLRLKTFPGALYNGDGTLLAGDGPELTDELTDEIPHKALIHIGARIEGIATLKEGDRFWLLPDTFGEPPVLPVLLLTDLVALARAGHRIGLAAREREAYEQARDALVLLLDDSGGRA
jgi:hypothetical protein